MLKRMYRKHGKDSTNSQATPETPDVAGYLSRTHRSYQRVLSPCSCHPSPIRLAMLSLWALLPKQGSLNYVMEGVGQSMMEFPISASCHALGLYYVTQRSRELRASGSLPPSPDKMPMHEAADRIKLIRNLPKGTFHILSFSLEAAVLQELLGSGQLVRSSNNPQILHGAIQIPSDAMVCQVRP